LTTFFLRYIKRLLF